MDSAWANQSETASRNRSRLNKKLVEGKCQIAFIVVFDIWIRDGYKIRIRIRDEEPESYFRKLRNNFFGLNSLMRIRDGKNLDPG
jgi:hypothetical protein